MIKLVRCPYPLQRGGRTEPPCVSMRTDAKALADFSVMRFPIFLLIPVAAFAQDANEIIRRATDRDFTNFENRKNYTYQERTELRQYNGKGKLSKTDVETSEILIL